MKYQILVANTLSELMELVHQLIEKGFTPIGGATQYFDSAMQTMIKRDENDG